MSDLPESTLLPLPFPFPELHNYFYSDMLIYKAYEWHIIGTLVTTKISMYLHTLQLNEYPLQSPSREGGKAGHEVSTSAASQPWRWSAAGQNSCGAPAAAQQPAAAVAGGVAGQLAAAGTAGTGAQHLAAAAQHGINYAAQVGLRPSK